MDDYGFLKESSCGKVFGGQRWLSADEAGEVPSFRVGRRSTRNEWFTRESGLCEWKHDTPKLPFTLRLSSFKHSLGISSFSTSG